MFQENVTLGNVPSQVGAPAEALPHAGTETPAPVSWVHWSDCEAIDNLTEVKFDNIKTPEAISSPPKNITVGIIIFLDKNVFATN